MTYIILISQKEKCLLRFHSNLIPRLCGVCQTLLLMPQITPVLVSFCFGGYSCPAFLPLCFLPLARDCFLRLMLWSCPSLSKPTTLFLICASNFRSCLSVLSFIAIFIFLMNPSLLPPVCCFSSGKRNLESTSGVISLL